MKNKNTHPYISQTERSLLHEVLAISTMALIMEKYHPKNRNLNVARVAALERDVNANKWNPNAGQYLYFDKNGNLIDGQKRVMAHLNAGLPLEINVHYGLPPDAILFMDGDQHRTLSDNYSLKVDGQPTRQEFSATRLRFSVAVWCMHGLHWAKDTTTSRTKVLWTETEILDFLKAHKKEIDFVLTDDRTTRRPGTLGAMAIYAMKDLEAATRFRDSVYGNGQGLTAGNPVHTLRKYLQVKSSGGSYPIYDYNNTLRCINAFQAGRRIKPSQLWNKPEDWEF